MKSKQTVGAALPSSKMFDDESDYVVEHFIKTDKVRVKSINDERADILGNFDDAKLKSTEGNHSYAPQYEEEENPFEDRTSSESENDEDADDDEGNEKDSNAIESDTNATSPASKPREIEVETKAKSVRNNVADKPHVQGTDDTSETSTPKALTDGQIQSLLRGASKKDRFVLYVTNLSYETTKPKLTKLFSTAGAVKSVRIPKTRKNAFAFIEMQDIHGFKVRKIIHIRMEKPLRSTPLYRIINIVLCFFPPRMHWVCIIIHWIRSTSRSRYRKAARRNRPTRRIFCVRRIENWPI